MKWTKFSVYPSDSYEIFCSYIFLAKYHGKVFYFIDLLLNPGRPEKICTVYNCRSGPLA